MTQVDTNNFMRISLETQELQLAQLAQMLADQNYKPNSMSSKTDLVKHYYDELKKGMGEFQGHLVKSFQLLNDLSREKEGERVAEIVPRLVSRLQTVFELLIHNYLENIGLKDPSQAPQLIMDETAGLDAEYLERVAEGVYNKEQIEEAFSLYTLLLTAYPGHSVIAAGFADCLEKLKGEQPTAEFYHNMAEEVNHPFFYLKAADFYLSHRSLEGARKCYEAGMELLKDPEESKRYGEFYVQLKQQLDKGV